NKIRLFPFQGCLPGAGKAKSIKGAFIMSVISIIFGILMVICGVSCMFTPMATFLSTGYFITILMLVYGVFGIVRFFQKKTGVLDLIVSILAVIVGVVCLVHPFESLAVDRFILYLIAVWLMVQGLVTIIVSFGARDVKKGWFWGVIVGILGMLAGIYSFAHPFLTAVVEGVLIGLYFVEAGLDMIFMGSAVGAARKDAKEAFEAAKKE
ncbi:MAG: DUF308 domain-containing protein, partial [Candidatus Limivicinus sp.]